MSADFVRAEGPEGGYRSTADYGKQRKEGHPLPGGKARVFAPSFPSFLASCFPLTTFSPIRVVQWYFPQLLLTVSSLPVFTEERC